MIWYLYVIRTVDDCLYTGITRDVRRRFNEHLSLGCKAAKYFHAHKPASLVFSTVIGERSLAHKVEYHFKKLKKTDKEKYIQLGKLLFTADTGEIISV